MPVFDRATRRMRVLDDDTATPAPELPPPPAHRRRGPDRLLRRSDAVLRQLELLVRNQLRHRVLGSDWLRPVYAIYELTWACNLDCTYCDDGAGHSYPRQAARMRPLPLADAVRLLARLRRDVPSLYVTGGEPTVHPDFLAILREIDRLRFSPVIVNSNGLRLPELLRADPQLLERIDVLVFSLDAVDPRVLDRLFRRRAGTGQRVLDALALCLERAPAAGCKVVVNCVVTPETIGDARGVAAFCAARGIPFMPVPANRGRGLLAPLGNVPAFRDLARNLAAAGVAGLGPPEVADTLMHLAPFECHPALRLHITPDGRVPWPCQSDARLMLPILDYPSIRALLRAAEAEVSVEAFGQRCGGPCYLAQNVSTDVYLRRPVAMVTRTLRDFLAPPRPGAGER